LKRFAKYYTIYKGRSEISPEMRLGGQNSFWAVFVIPFFETAGINNDGKRRHV